VTQSGLYKLDIG